VPAVIDLSGSEGLPILTAVFRSSMCVCRTKSLPWQE
jgi:hypothetical protein